MKKNFSQSILQKIEQEAIKPRPRWYFWLKNTAFWIIFVLSVLIGARAVGVMIRILAAPDLAMMMKSHGQLIKPLWTLLPSFWIAIFSLLIILAILGLHQTRHGYRLSMSKLIGINLVLSILLGAGSYAIGDAQRFEEMTEKFAPFIETADERREKIWSDPEEGRLAGIIIEIQNHDIFLIDDLQHQRWQVTFSDAQLWDGIEIKPHIKVRMAGELLEHELFKASVISPWVPPRNLFQKRSKTQLVKKMLDELNEELSE